MTVELDTVEGNREPTTELMNAIFEITSGFQKTAQAIDNAFFIGREQGFTDKRIGDLIREQMLAAGFNPSTIRKALPASAKHSEFANKALKSSASEQTVNIPTEYNVQESESTSASSTGPDGQEIEQEIEVKGENIRVEIEEQITPPILPDGVETVTVPKVEYEELKEALTQATTIAPATQEVKRSFKQKFATQKDITDFFIAIRKLHPGEGCLQYIVNENNEVVEYKVWQYCDEAPTK